MSVLATMSKWEAVPPMKRMPNTGLRVDLQGSILARLLEPAGGLKSERIERALKSEELLQPIDRLHCQDGSSTCAPSHVLHGEFIVVVIR